MAKLDDDMATIAAAYRRPPGWVRSMLAEASDGDYERAKDFGARVSPGSPLVVEWAGMVLVGTFEEVVARIASEIRHG